MSNCGSLPVSPLPQGGRSTPNTWPMAVGVGCWGGSISILFSDVSLYGSWEIFKHLPGSPGVDFGPKAANSAPNPGRKQTMNTRKQKEKQLTPRFYRLVSALWYKQMFKRNKMSRCGKWACPQWKLLPDPIAVILSISRGSQAAWSEQSEKSAPPY